MEKSSIIIAINDIQHNYLQFKSMKDKGGFGVGIFMNGMDFNSALRTYSILTIGDGLTSQLPSIIISFATGLLVTGTKSDETFDKFSVDVESLKNDFEYLKSLIHQYDHYDHERKPNNQFYQNGFHFRSPRHDIFSMGDKISNASWKYKYESTAAAGRTIFMRLTKTWKDAHNTEKWHGGR